MAIGPHRLEYEVLEGWEQLPEGWSFVEVAGVAVDSRDRVYVFNRGAHPMIVFDKEGRFLDAWGEGIFSSAHGIFIDQHDHVYCADNFDHTVRKFTTDGELLMTLGDPKRPADTGFKIGESPVRRAAGPFNMVTNVAVTGSGEMYISDGYGNARVHRFSPTGELLASWGEPGTGPGQFNLPHGIAVDRGGRVFVADRENSRDPDLQLERRLPARVGLGQPAGRSVHRRAGEPLHRRARLDRAAFPTGRTSRGASMRRSAMRRSRGSRSATPMATSRPRSAATTRCCPATSSRRTGSGRTRAAISTSARWSRRRARSSTSRRSPATPSRNSCAPADWRRSATRRPLAASSRAGPGGLGIARPVSRGCGSGTRVDARMSGRRPLRVAWRGHVPVGGRRFPPAAINPTPGAQDEVEGSDADRPHHRASRRTCGSPGRRRRPN